MSVQMHSPTPSDASGLLALMDFGALQTRYQALPVAARAQAVLKDAEPALQAAESVLAELAASGKAGKAFDALRANAALTGKMRPSEAKTTLMDAKNDFIGLTLHKLAAWRKTVERLTQGEGVSKGSKGEYIPADMPVAAAVAAMSAAGGYLSVIQLALSELARTDHKQASKCQANIARIRRAATLISDCETASGLGGLVH